MVKKTAGVAVAILLLRTSDVSVAQLSSPQYISNPNHREIAVMAFELALSAGFSDSGISYQEIQTRLEAGTYSEDFEPINETVMEYLKRRGANPSAIAISPGSYRWLLEIRSSEHAIGNLIIGCAAVREIETEAGKIRLVIDEMLEETAVDILNEL